VGDMGGKAPIWKDWPEAGMGGVQMPTRHRGRIICQQHNLEIRHGGKPGCMAITPANEPAVAVAVGLMRSKVCVSALAYGLRVWVIFLPPMPVHR